ncbi:VOC family protein [Bdellovibrio sp. HCB337]|uniref:VOC family protein n=1 Tax=Bdellovibrio sp. HCB337 TaxID=3394358 RepID=UPI0039A63978
MKNPQMIFINLPTTNLERSKAFYQAIGFTYNPQFSDETGICMVLSETIFVMVLTHPKWKQFTTKTIPDAKTSAQVMLAISSDSKSNVDAIVKKAAQAGGKADPLPAQDLDFMYGRIFEDPDGHIWESYWMDMSALPPQG